MFLVVMVGWFKGSPNTDFFVGLRPQLVWDYFCSTIISIRNAAGNSLYTLFLDYTYQVVLHRQLIMKIFKYYASSLIKFFIFSYIFLNFFYKLILVIFPLQLLLWDLESIFDYLIFFLSFININNILILFCAFYATNSSIFESDFFFLELGLNWVEFFVLFDYGLSITTIPCFLEELFLQSLLYFSFLDYSDLFMPNQIPYFFFFFILFFCTVILSWFFFSYLGIYGIFKINLISLFMFWLSLLFYISNIFVENKVYEIKIFNWIFLNTNMKIDCFFLIDTISFSFILLTTTISLFVFIYAFSYFRYEPLVDRFLLFLLSFVVSMIFLVSSGNLIMLFLGWELIGLTSFFLINFWTTKTSTLKSSFKAFSFNKVSDFFLFMFIVCIYNTYNTLDITVFLTGLYKYKITYITLFNFELSTLEFLSICLLFSAFIKSAQLGGHIWLPDSMEAPVPASALIHSATLVSAGIYLILRFNTLFNYTQFSHLLLPVIGSLTAAYGGICAVTQTDLKKILAYSTISHCGFLVLLCSLEMNEFVIMYLYVHGFFKAIIFMCVGNVLRISQNYQDYRRMGNLFKYLPFEYYCMLISLANLAGLPFTFGFFTKHLVFLSLEQHIYIYYFVLFNTLVGAISSLFYSYKLLKNIFFGFKKGNKALYLSLNDLSYNSIYYTNTSLASNIAILLLFLSSNIIIYFIFNCFIKNNQIFSDCFNLTLLSSYYFIIKSYSGFNLNFVYLNVLVILSFIFLYYTTYSRTIRIHLVYKNLFFILYFWSMFYLFYFLLFPFIFNFFIFK